MTELEYLLDVLNNYSSKAVLTVESLSKMISEAIDKKYKEDSEFDEQQSNAIKHQGDSFKSNNNKGKPW